MDISDNHDRTIMHNLIVTMQLAYYLNGGDSNFAKANEVMREVALNAIRKKRIPRSMYVFASALASPKNLKDFMNQVHTMFEQDNPGGDHGTLAMPT